MQTFYKICLILMIVGGINWGLVGLFQFDFVGWLLGGSASIWSRIVFTLVGVAAVCAAAGNALEECSGAKDNEAIKAALRENGAVTALMTGSGAAVFGVFRTEAEAKAAADALRARWPQVYTAQPVRGGACPLRHLR